MLRYAISDRRLFLGSDREQQQRLVQQAELLAREGVDYFQVREKDLQNDALLALACAVRDAVRSTGAAMQVVLNGPRSVSESAGVAWHRTASDDNNGEACLSCSVHSAEQVAAQRLHASLLLFAPIFGKTVQGQGVLPGVGLNRLQAAVEHAGTTPVLALGGVTMQNAEVCMRAGAAGIAGIRLFLR